MGRACDGMLMKNSSPFQGVIRKTSSVSLKLGTINDNQADNSLSVRFCVDGGRPMRDQSEAMFDIAFKDKL